MLFQKSAHLLAVTAHAQYLFRPPFNEAELPSSYSCQSTPRASISPPAFPISASLPTHLKQELAAALFSSSSDDNNNNSKPERKRLLVRFSHPLVIEWVGGWAPYGDPLSCGSSSAFPLKYEIKRETLQSCRRSSLNGGKTLSCFVVSLAFDQRLCSCCIYAAPSSVSDPCDPLQALL